MISDVLTTSEGVPIQGQTIGFLARSVTVDNNTSSWAYLPATGLFVPPFMSRTMALPSPVTVAIVLWQAPGGYSQLQTSSGGLLVGGQLQCVWSDEPAATSAPVALSPASTSTFAVVASGGSSVFASPTTVTLPTGTQAIVTFAYDNTNHKIVSFGGYVASGSAPSYTYPGSVAGPCVAQVVPGETSVTVSHPNPLTPNISWWVAASTVPMAPAPTYGPRGSVARLVRISAGFGVAGGDYTIIPGAGNERIYLQHICLVMDGTVAGGVLQAWDGASAGGRAITEWGAIASVGPHNNPFNGYALTTGNALVFTSAAGGGTIVARGYVTYWTTGDPA